MHPWHVSSEWDGVLILPCTSPDLSGLFVKLRPHPRPPSSRSLAFPQPISLLYPAHRQSFVRFVCLYSFPPSSGPPYPRATASLGQLEAVGNSLHAYTQTSFVLTRAPETAPFEPPPTVSEAPSEDGVDLHRPPPRRVGLSPAVSTSDRHLPTWADVPRTGIVTSFTITAKNKKSAQSLLLRAAWTLQTSIPRRQPYRRRAQPT